MWKTIQKYGAVYDTDDDRGLIILKDEEGQEYNLELKATEFTLTLTMLQGSDVVRYSAEAKALRTGTEEVG